MNMFGGLILHLTVNETLMNDTLMKVNEFVFLERIVLHKILRECACLH